MHELSLMNAVIQEVIQISAANGRRPVTRVTLRIGALRQVVPESLPVAFQAASEGTCAERATLEWTVQPARVACEFCQGVFSPTDRIWICPGCGAGGGRILDGDQLLIESVELLDDNALEEALRES